MFNRVFFSIFEMLSFLTEIYFLLLSFPICITLREEIFAQFIFAHEGTKNCMFVRNLFLRIQHNYMNLRNLFLQILFFSFNLRNFADFASYADIQIFGVISDNNQKLSSRIEVSEINSWFNKYFIIIFTDICGIYFCESWLLLEFCIITFCGWTNFLHFF